MGGVRERDAGKMATHLKLWKPSNERTELIVGRLTVKAASKDATHEASAAAAETLARAGGGQAGLALFDILLGKIGLERGIKLGS